MPKQEKQVQCIQSNKCDKATNCPHAKPHIKIRNGGFHYCYHNCRDEVMLMCGTHGKSPEGEPYYLTQECEEVD